MPSIHVTVCICTYRRLELLRRLLEALTKLSNDEGALSWSCVVVDNDANGSARCIVDRFCQETDLSVTYDIEPERNFALVRNRTIAHSRGEFIAFVDDDEVPVPEWLVQLVKTQRKYGCDGVLGPVRPYFDSEPPRWIIKGKLCERPVHPTGMRMPWDKSRTGNVLISRRLFTEVGLKFDPAYATGGEDVDFFKRAAAAGFSFVWCEEAPAYELVPPERCRKSYFLRRALLQGRISLKYAAKRMTPVARIKIGVHALVALAAYLVALPFFMIAGFHVFMKYLIKCCHHLGRVSALFGIELVAQRNF